MNDMIQTADSQVLFVGSFTHSLDAKRRIIFPSTWRNQMGDAHRMFAFPHPEDKCLYLYSEGEMMRRLNQLRSGGPLDKADQQTLRSFTAGAAMLGWDAQGRIRIGDHLLGHAEVKEQVVLVGTLTRIELWSVENFDLALPGDSAAAEDVLYGGY